MFKKILSIMGSVVMILAVCFFVNTKTHAEGNIASKALTPMAHYKVPTPPPLPSTKPIPMPSIAIPSFKPFPSPSFEPLPTPKTGTPKTYPSPFYRH